MRRWQLVVGKLLPYGLIGMIDIFLVVGVARFWFNVPLLGITLAIAMPVELEPLAVTSTGSVKELLASIPNTPAVVCNAPLVVRKSKVATPFTVESGEMSSPHATCCAVVKSAPLGKRKVARSRAGELVRLPACIGFPGVSVHVSPTL